MARSVNRDPSIKQQNDASCINNVRGMARRAKRHSNKVDRRLLAKDLEMRCTERETDGQATGEY